MGCSELLLKLNLILYFFQKLVSNYTKVYAWHIGFLTPCNKNYSSLHRWHEDIFQPGKRTRLLDFWNKKCLSGTWTVMIGGMYSQGGNDFWTMTTCLTISQANFSYFL